MAAGAFFYPGGAPGTPTTGSGNYCIGADVSPTIAGIRILGVYYLKVVGDTVANRPVTVYRTSDQAVMGTGNFSGETASGWQSMTFGTPITLASGSTYRIATLTGTTYGYNTSFSGGSRGGITMSPNSAYQAGTSLVYPTNSGANAWNGIDVSMDGLSPTEFRASQVGAEVWGPSSPALRASQLVAETWVPNTALQDSQVVAETWVTPSTALRASQVTVEEWLAVTGLRASQGLAETWTTDVAELRASQLLAEVWAQLQPPTALQASQLLAEVWTTDVPIALIASQDLAEVWLRPGVAVGYRRHNVSAHVTRSP